MNRTQLQPKPQFTDRVWELQAIAHRLEILHSGGGVFQCVINFYGILGIGKTTLLEELLRRAQTGRWNGQSLAPTLSALTDLAGDQAFLNADQGGPEVLAHQMRQLEQQTRQPNVEFFQALRAFRALEVPDPYDEEAWYAFRQKAKRVADIFSLYVYRHATQKKQPVMLLFDNSEALPAEAFDWLEYEVFSPLVQTDRILLVVAGRSPVRWKRFEVRRRVWLHKLNPPQDGMLVEQQAPSWSRLAPNIVQITFNYPPANQAIVEELEKLGPAQELDATVFARHQPALIQRLVADVIEKNLLDSVDPDLRRALRVIAPLRQFDVTTLRAMLPEFAPEQFAERGGNYYLLMLNRLVDTALVEWSAERKAYVLDDTLRRILALELETRDTDFSQRVHQRAAELYRRWLGEVPEARSSYLVEWLYHRAQAMRLQGMERPAIALTILADLQGALKAFYQLEKAADDRLLDSARRLVEELKRDPDLPDLVEPGAVSRLVVAVEEAVPALKQAAGPSR